MASVKAARSALANPAYRFAGLVIVAGAVLLAVLAVEGEFHAIAHPSTRMVAFMLLAAGGEMWMMRVPSRTSWSLISASSLFTLATVVVYGVGPAVIALGVGSFLKDVRDQRKGIKRWFNVAQHVISVSFAAGAYSLLGGDLGAFHADSLPAILGAGLAFMLSNALLTCAVVALANGNRLISQLRRDFEAWLLIEGVMLGFTPVVVVATQSSLWLIPMLALPFLGVRQSARIAMRSDHAAMHDALTGLPNRVLFREQVDQAIERKRHSGGSLGVMILDLDRFKEVNDTLGHGQGDVLLRSIAERLGNALRDVDVVARLGGDEFGVMVSLRKHDPPAIVQVAERIRDALEPPFSLGDLWIDAGASIGIAISSDDADDAEALLQQADVAMYLAKHSGSGYETYDIARDPNGPERLELIRDLRHGIHNDELVLHYQPKIEVRTGRLVGFEALVRWQHPVRGLLPPADFIELAERTDAVRSLTLQVVEKALAQVKAWSEEGREMPVAVNLSARVLLDATLPADIERLLDEAGVDPSLLEVELTESSLIADPDRTAVILGRLNAAGVRVTIDDFGTGYSSLVLLRRLPVDAIKVDRSFVGEMHRSGEDAAIVESTISLADSLGIDVVAEGVESAEILDQLRAMGCHQAQGFYMCRPKPADELEAWVEAGRFEPALA